MKTGIVSIVGLLLVLFLVMMLASNGVVGYSSSKTLAEYPYEGFEAALNAFAKRSEDKQYAEAFSEFGGDKKHGDKKHGEKMTPMSPVPGPVPAAGAEPSNKGSFAKEGFEPMEQPLKVAGFSGLQSGAYGSEQLIGFMYNNEGSLSCKSYGYTNSKGNICMSGSDIKLLTTRGGNATGASDQIGASAIESKILPK